MAEAEGTNGDVGEELPPVSVYRLNNHDWWVARSLHDAVVSAAAEHGVSEDEVLDELHPPYKVHDLMLMTLQIRVSGEVVTFKEALDSYLSSGQAIPARFATT